MHDDGVDTDSLTHETKAFLDLIQADAGCDEAVQVQTAGTVVPDDVRQLRAWLDVSDERPAKGALRSRRSGPCSSARFPECATGAHATRSRREHAREPADAAKTYGRTAPDARRRSRSRYDWSEMRMSDWPGPCLGQ